MRSLRSPLPIRLLRCAASFACRSLRSLVEQARGEHRHRLRAVAVLRAVVLAFDDDAGRQVRDAHRRVGLVDVLAAGARRAERVDAQVGGIDRDVGDRIGLRHHRHRARRRVDAPLRLGLRHALHAMAARLELELRVRAVARRCARSLPCSRRARTATPTRSRPASDCARRSARTCGTGRRRTAPTRRRRCRRGSRGTRCARRSGPSAAARACSSRLERVDARLRALRAPPRRTRASRDRAAMLVGGREIGLGLPVAREQRATTGPISACSLRERAIAVHVARRRPARRAGASSSARRAASWSSLRRSEDFMS